MTPIEKMLSGFLVAAAMLAAGMVSLTWSDDLVDLSIDDSAIFSRFSSRHELTEFFGGAQDHGWYGSGPAPMLESKFGLSGNDYSKTNVQVEGIDELDTVKTDGQNIYVASEYGVSIIRAYPPEQMSNLTFLSMDDMVPSHLDDAYASFDGLFLLQDRLVVVTSWHQQYYWYGYDILLPESSASPRLPWSTVSVFDISDAEHPELIYTAGITGSTATARLVRDTVYLITQHSPYIAEEGIVLPMVSSDDARAEIPLSMIRYDPEMTDADAFTNILAVDVGEQEQSMISVVTGYSSTIYVSPESIYLTAEKYPESVTHWEEATAAAEIDTVRTTIYKISYDGLVMGATAKGEVKGTLLNQFSMDEFGYHLRVATNSGWTNPANSVYVLDQELKVVGALENIAPNESIYSSRFVGDTLYLVTFRQIDPLFVIDISDPSDPRIAGELTLPGFSTYLHPVDGDHLIGIGSENGLAKVTMFDVSDPANPKEQSTWVLSGYDSSSTVWDHKQVLFDAEKALLVLPITAYDWLNYDHTGSVNAAFVFNVTVDGGVELRGTIEMNNTGYSGWDIRRSLYIEDYLYTVWGMSVKANMLSDLSEAGFLEYYTQPVPSYLVRF
jgi:uncharacterized secreted protein with C-terminal beta-propeller domain